MTGHSAGAAQRGVRPPLSPTDRRGGTMTGVGETADPRPGGADGGGPTRLTVELVPSTCWYTNVRSNVPKAVWDRLRRRVAAEAGRRCEICGGRGRRWPVECHEVWDYDDDRKIQRLERLAALCPACHEVKHAGLASKRGRLPQVIGHLATVNGWSENDAALYLEGVFEQWSARSRHQWTLDITVLRARYGLEGVDDGA